MYFLAVTNAELLNSGAVQASTLVWSEGWPDWTPLSALVSPGVAVTVQGAAVTLPDTGVTVGASSDDPERTGAAAAGAQGLSAEQRNGGLHLP